MIYTFEDRDEFNRKPMADKLIGLLVSDIDLSPVVIDGAWGSGKSEFCKKFLNLAALSKADFRTVYVDAFKYDHCGDPLLMLITELSKLIDNDPEKKKDFLKNALPVLKVLSKTVLKAGVSHVLKVSADKLSSEMHEVLVEGAGDTYEVGIEGILKDFESVDEKIEIFKKALLSISKEKKVVIIIDELDRCRPSFALETLEKVKHVFNIDSIQFVFSTNLKQLNAMVKKQYGQEIHSEFYLAKFFNYIIKLPNHTTPDDYFYYHNGVTQFFNLIGTNPLFANLHDRGHLSTRVMKHLFERDNISLRDSERFYRNLKIFAALKSNIAFNESTTNIYSQLYFFAVYIYTFHSQFAEKIFANNVKEEDVCNFFGTKFDDLSSGHPEDLEYFVLFLLACEKASIHHAVHKELKDHWINVIAGMFPRTRMMAHKEINNILKSAMKTMQLK